MSTKEKTDESEETAKGGGLSISVERGIAPPASSFCATCAPAGFPVTSEIAAKGTTSSASFAMRL